MFGNSALEVMGAKMKMSPRPLSSARSSQSSCFSPMCAPYSQRSTESSSTPGFSQDDLSSCTSVSDKGPCQSSKQSSSHRTSQMYGNDSSNTLGRSVNFVKSATSEFKDDVTNKGYFTSNKPSANGDPLDSPVTSLAKKEYILTNNDLEGLHPNEDIHDYLSTEDSESEDNERQWSKKILSEVMFRSTYFPAARNTEGNCKLIDVSNFKTSVNDEMSGPAAVKEKQETSFRKESNTESSSMDQNACSDDYQVLDVKKPCVKETHIGTSLFDSGEEAQSPKVRKEPSTSTRTVHLPQPLSLETSTYMTAQARAQPFTTDHEERPRQEGPDAFSQHRRLSSPPRTSIPSSLPSHDHPKTPCQTAEYVVIPSTLPYLQVTTTDRLPFKSKSWLQTQVEKRAQSCQQSGHLDLAGFALPFFPSAVLDVDCSNVHRVSLQDNSLKTIPGAVLLHLPHTTWLDLRFNAMELLPPEIGNLTQLQVLLLSGNNLRTLPLTMGKLMDLMTLQVSDNPLEFPPRMVVQTGTRAIITYLASMLLKKTTTAGEEDEEDERESLDKHCECLGCKGCGDQGKEAEDEAVKKHNCCNIVFGDHERDFPNPCVERYKYSSPPILEMIHLDIHPEEDPINSYRDSLGYASTPTSPCLLTPDWDLPGRPQYYSPWLDDGVEVQGDEDKDQEHKVEDGGECQCHCNSKQQSSERLRIEFEKRWNSHEPWHGSSSRNLELRHRRQHVHLPNHSFSSSTFISTMDRVGEMKKEYEDSLEGDVGEGYRCTSQGKAPQKECLRQSSHESTTSSLPLVCVQLPSPDWHLPSNFKTNNHEGKNINTKPAPSVEMKSVVASHQGRRGISRSAHSCRRGSNRRFSRLPSCPRK